MSFESAGDRTLDPNATTSAEVIARFSRSAQAAEKLNEWKNDETKTHVVERVLAHTVRYLNTVTTPEVLQIVEYINTHPNEHALGKIKSATVKRVESIRDWHSPFAYAHLFHFIAEAEHRLLTFNEFIHHTIFQEGMWKDAEQAIEAAIKIDRVTKQDAKDAVRWRIGLAYYAFLKEQYIMSLMRGEGRQVKQHPLADALFRVDCWIDDVNIDLYVENDKFRKQKSGRKIKSAALLRDAVPAFRNAVIECKIQNTFGKVHLPNMEHVRQVCSEVLPAV
jgi:hypothetical protein